MNLRRQRHRLLIQFLQLNMNVAQRLLEVELLIHFRRGDANVAAGGEAVIGGFDLLAGDDAA